MPINVVIGGVTHQVPSTGEKSWGTYTSDTLVALAALSGAVDGTKTNSLTADAVFTTFGLVAEYFKSSTTLTAAAGVLRLKVGDTVSWRNNADDGDLALSIDGSDLLNFAGSPLSTSGDLNAHLADLANPHVVTQTQVGLSNVTNVATDDTAYNATTWNTNLDAPTKNAVRDQVEVVVADVATNTASNTGVVTVHSDVTDAGSGIIISAAERTAISTNTTNVALKADKTTTVTGTGNLDGGGDLSTNRTLDIIDNPQFEGTESIGLPVGTTLERPSGTNGQFRYNSDDATFEGYAAGSWGAIGGGGLQLQTITNADSPVTAATGTHYLCDTTSGTITINLPDLSALSSSQQVSASIAFSDCAYTWDTNAVTLHPFSGDSISDGATDEDWTLDLEAQNVQVNFEDTTTWCLDTNITPSVAAATSSGDALGKNYVLNPSAAENVDNVTNTATTGSWTIAQTTTSSELPEESIGSAFKISGTTLTDADTVEFAIKTTFIDDADGGPATVSAKVKDISGTIDGQYKLQLYSVTDSTYIGESLTVVSDGTYRFGANVIAGDDYEVHLIAVGTTQSDIGISSITLEPTALLKTAVISAWQAYTPTLTGFGTVTSLSAKWRQVGENVELCADYTTGTTTGTIAELSLPNGYTVDTGNANPLRVGDMATANTTTGRMHTPIATDGDTFLEYGTLYNTDFNGGSFTAKGGSNMENTTRYQVTASVPVAEFANAGVVVPVSDFTRKTKWVDATTVGVSGINGFSDAGSLFKAYSDSLGQWFMDFIIIASKTSNASGETLTFTETMNFVSTKTPVDTYLNSSGSGRAESETIITGATGSSTTELRVSGSGIKLTAEPSWATANLENAVSVAAYIPDEEVATTTKQQLLPNIRSSGDGASGEGDLGTIGNWATVDSKKYRWYVVGKICFFELRAESTTASTSITSISVTIPSDVPQPSLFSNSATSEWAIAGSGGRSTTTGSAFDSQGAGIYYDGAFQFYTYTSAAQASKLWIANAFWRID